MGRKLKYTQSDVDKLFQLRLSGYNVRKIAEIITTVSYSTLIKIWNDLATPEQKELATVAEAQRRRAMADKQKITIPTEHTGSVPTLVASDAVSLHTEALNRVSESLAPLASIAQSLERIAAALEERPLPNAMAGTTISTNGNGKVASPTIRSSNGHPDDFELTDTQKSKIKEHHNDGICEDEISDLMGIDVEVITTFLEEFSMRDPFESVMREDIDWG